MIARCLRFFNNLTTFMQSKIAGCDDRHYLSGSECLPCATVSSSNDGQRLTDGDTDTCVTIQPQDGAVLQYELSVNKTCSHDNTGSVKVTAAIETNCYDLESMFVTEGSEEKCGKNSVKMTRCEMTESAVDDGNRVCSLKCKCADSANSCVRSIQMYTPMKAMDVQICELKATN